jgi:hypothetical protein
MPIASFADGASPGWVVLAPGVATFYAEKSLALSGHAQLIDRAAGRIVDVSTLPANPVASTSC